jgi:hypothetical protein
MVYSENHAKHNNAVCRKNADVFTVKLFHIVTIGLKGQAEN